MSVATSLRDFIVAMALMPISQVAQESIPEEYDSDLGFIWFARRNTQPVRTMQRASGPPEQQFFDIEIYHPDINVVEQVADIVQTYDCYRGVFGAGKIQGFFVSDQSDDYVPQVDMTDTAHLSSSFLSLEVRSYRE